MERAAAQQCLRGEPGRLSPQRGHWTGRAGKRTVGEYRKLELTFCTFGAFGTDTSMTVTSHQTTVRIEVLCHQNTFGITHDYT